MSRLYLVAFVAVAGLAVAGVDYADQAKRTGKGLTGLGLAGYKETIVSRFASHQAEQAAADRRDDLLDTARRDLLPPAPDGWVRRDYSDADRALLEVAHDPMAGVPPEAAQALGALAAAGERQQRAREAAETYVYESEAALISLRLTYLDPDRQAGGIHGAALQIVQGNMEAMSAADAFALVKGVAFREELGLLGGGPEERAFRVFTGMIGSEIRLSVRARAADEDIVALLSAIDYDTLNQMLTTPVAGIGSDAPELDAATSAALAEAAVAAQSDAIVARGNAAEARFMEAGRTLDDEDASVAERGGALLGMMFGTAEDNAPVAVPMPAEISITPAPSATPIESTCTIDGGRKRCRIGAGPVAP